MKIIRKIKRTGLNLLVRRKRIKGYTVGNAKRWLRNMYRDLRKNREYGLGKKIWAYRRGFLPGFIDRNSIQSSNYKDYISERDYNYVASINGTYAKWITDRVTAHKVLKKFSDYLPQDYYNFYKRGSQVCVKCLEECPENYGDTFDDVVALIKEKKDLILTTSKYSKSYARRIKYNDKTKQILFSGVPSSDKEIVNIIKERCLKGMTLVLMERVVMHPQFQAHHNSRGTVCRLVVINESGSHGEITDAHLILDGGYYVINNQGKGVSVDNLDAYLEESQSITAIDTDLDHTHKGSLEKNGKLYQLKSELKTRNLISDINISDGSFQGARELLGKEIQKHENNPRDGVKIKGVIPHWEEIQTIVDEICCYIPQVEYMGMDIAITKDGFKIVRFEDHPSFSKVFLFSKKTQDFLKLKLEEKKKERLTGKAKRAESARLFRLGWMSFVSKLLYPNGIRRRLTLYWIEEIFTDFRQNKDVSLKDKLWAYRHGFLSYRLAQYGITRENHLEYISDLEYLFVRHINNDYKTWLEDKITIKYVCQKFNDCFPGYYYYVSMRNGNSRIIPLMDCPEGYGTAHQDIINLAKEKGILALKPDRGSWGKGFYRLEYIDSKFYLNFEEASEAQVLELLSDPGTQYLVTEYIQMHPDLKKIYSGSVNTIRMIVYKRDGKNATIGNAYMRFGSTATGAVDNMRAGGMFARIDIDTGRYYDSKILENNMIVDRACHPDTGVKIEGILPNWEKVKSLVIDIANSFDQLEYFGFDIAITEDGIKLPEINRYPGYPRIETFNRDTIDYLLERLAEKEKKYGYDKKLPKKLMKLQDRTHQ
ncbi:MAG: sugar-transfer associated ATP-grasp domain-containing protein [Lachnospiraceae bacterium]